jgi:hypothetical protein
VVSQLLTLYLTPVVYVYLDRIAKRLSPRPVAEFEAEAAASASHQK